jgi:hypothetical protein
MVAAATAVAVTVAAIGEPVAFMPGAANVPAAATRRIVLLGASNLTLGISTVVETARNIWRQPLDVMAALGHGRSYGGNSCVLGRQLVGILNSGLWDDLAARAALPTSALITDVGNDLLYEVEVPQLVAWVGEAIDRLHRQQAQVCLTLLPTDSIARLGPMRFGFFRRLFFPRCRFELPEVVDRARLLHDQLQQLAAVRGIPCVEQRGQWYGIDPIHIRRAHWRYAWREILSTWNAADPSPELAQGSWSRWIYLQSRRPQSQTVLGRVQQTKQPSAMLEDGTTIAFY